MSRAWGNLYLAYRALVVRPIKAAAGRDGGIERFHDNYRPEGLIPTRPRDRAALAAAGRCISCGLCDAFDPNLAKLARWSYDGASLLPRQYARSSVDLPHAREVVARIRPADLRRAEAVCPTGVPLVELAHWLAERADRLSLFGSPRSVERPVAP